MNAADLAFAGLARQAELIRAGEVSSRELTELYLERIGRLDPLVRGYRIVLAEEALAAADAADRRRGEDAPRLNGVPIAIKDDADIAGQITARGSLAHGGPAADDDEVVRRLRAAGVVMLGKTHVAEMEAMATTESLAFGATHNPWDLARTCGGSSGGSAVAVAAGMAAAALGSDGAGSIRIPAGCCGLFGLKPQRGRLPRAHDWNGMSASGALTRGVLDCALFLDATSEPGPVLADAARRAPGALRIAYSLKVPRGLTASVDAEERHGVERTAERLRDLGHTVQERDPDYGGVAVNVTTRYLEGVRIESDRMAHPERLARATRGLASMGAKIPSFVVERAHAQEAADRERIGAVFDAFDVLMTPVFTRRPPLIGEWSGLPAPLMLNGMANFVPHLPIWNHTGQPAAAIPVESAPDGFPVAVQLVGRTGDEATLLSLSAQLETETGWLERRPPLAA
ncbi:MAG TPA: amidase [Solirubrobacteraceae bacterium]|nr:amidase [Solirubrobacteraceae bacterium]